MSVIEFIIKCIKCKNDFNQGADIHRRICNDCRYDKVIAKRKRTYIKKQNKKTNFFSKTCIMCEREFKTKIKHKKYCTKKCKEQTSKISIQLERTEKNLIKLDERIIKVNELYEEKMNKLQKQLDYYNNGAEKQHLKYTQNMERLQLIQHRVGKDFEI